MTFARYTKVNISTTQADIQRCLRRYDASGFAIGEESGMGLVRFRFGSLVVEFKVAMSIKPGASFRTETDRRRAEQEDRSRWRCLLLAIKAKLECVESGISTLEQELLPFVVTDDGRTFYERLRPALEAAREGKPLAKLLTAS